MRIHGGCSCRNLPSGEAIPSRERQGRQRRDGAGYDLLPGHAVQVFAIAQIQGFVGAAPPRERNNSALNLRNTQNDTVLSPN